MAKYVFVTGGVVSSIGKGITTACLGRLLRSATASCEEPHDHDKCDLLHRRPGVQRGRGHAVQRSGCIHAVKRRLSRLRYGSRV